MAATFLNYGINISTGKGILIVKNKIYGIGREQLGEVSVLSFLRDQLAET